MERCRPHSILPYQKELDTVEITAALRRFPADFAIQVSDYLTWRGIETDLDTRRLIRKTLELSESLRTVSGLARALYMSRRALGRRFMTRGLPVPSHWLHFGRLLRAAVKLQDPVASLVEVARSLGYPDAFSLSNQMSRLTGLRPSIMKECFGWEWIVETWLRTEAAEGGIPDSVSRALFPPEASTRSAKAQALGSDDARVSSRALKVGERIPLKPNNGNDAS
jgi:AraC-like DNA-binding protein